MANWPFTMKDIQINAQGESFARGEDYANRGAVLSITRRGNRLIGEVEGSDVDPYLVTILLDETAIISAECTCPYEWGGWCKHIVAVLLTCLEVPGAVEDRPSVATMLATLDRDQLAALLTSMSEADGRLIDTIENHLGQIPSTSRPARAEASSNPRIAPSMPAAAVTMPTLPDPKSIKKDIRAAAKGIGRGWDYEYDDDGSAAVLELEEAAEPYLETAQAFIEAGEGHPALALLDPLTEALLDVWDDVEDMVGSLDDLYSDIGGKMAEALLSPDVSADERLAWVTRVRAWRGNGEYTGADAGLAAAEQAALTGWDYPPLLRVLRGEVDERGAWDEDPPEGADGLAIARLNVLERQGRIQEALFFAEAEGETVRYLLLLIRSGRARQAFDQGRDQLVDRAEILIIARALLEQGEQDLALKLGEHGLTVERGEIGFQPPVKPLADWLRDTALEAKSIELAIKAAEVGLREAPSLADYQRLEQIAGARMEDMREKLLKSLAKSQSYSNSGAIDILLHEGRGAEALQLVADTWDYTLKARVIDEVIADLPEPTIPISKKEAEGIMDAGKAAHYDAAARWVERVRDAYRVLKQEPEWQAYKASLLDKHVRKYKLVPMLKSL